MPQASTRPHMLAAKIDFRIYSCHLMIIIISKHLRMSVFNRRWLHWRLGPFDTFGLIGVSPSLIGLQRCFMKSAPQFSSHYSNCDIFFSPVLAIFFSITITSLTPSPGCFSPCPLICVKKIGMNLQASLCVPHPHTF